MGTLGRHLVESTLYKEDDYAFGHTAVWGSLWEAFADGGSGAGRWGYKCCSGFVRELRCPNSAAPPEPAQNHYPPGDDAAPLEEMPDELQRQESFDGSPGAYVQHVISWLLRAWRTKLTAGDPTIAADALFCQKSELQKAEESLQPLQELVFRVETRLRRAKRFGHGLGMAPTVATERDDWECPHCRYTNRGHRIVCRKCKKADDNYVEPDEFPKFEQIILEKVEKITVLIAAQDFAGANESFLALTLGHARWRSDIMGLTGMTGAPTRKARAAQGHMRRQRAEMAPMDSEEGQLYLASLKRLITLAQLLRPNLEDSSRNIVR
eukprot:TRINITY_DN44821_c0_g1_i1.p1 TRINITY_DN44821_c0_g1~~TRINITY_DN44821_c0_g1_i1.p1  ORF type:complete len:323 (-),score=32.50 TRINITY_DN44821_c0_g1_i1:417-1385(-)